MTKKIKVAILMGGKSPEHEISLITGRKVVKNLPKKYDALPVIISRTGETWRITSPAKLLSLKDPLKLRGTSKELIPLESKEIQGAIGVRKEKVDVVFIAMHGPFGEDGTVQGMLEIAGIIYTGSGVLASALGMDKEMFRRIMKAEQLPVPKYVVIEKGEPLGNIFKSLAKPPYFVKPNNQGSSVGASIVKSKSSLSRAISLAYEYGSKALVDEYIHGLEVTCGVLGNNKPIPLPVVEIVPLKGEFFDYESKYTESGAEEIVPARISTMLTKEIQDLAVKVYKAIGARGFSRVDFILKEKRHPVVLEINTIPGLTQMSLLPKAAKEAGITYSNLLDKIIKYALE